MLLKIKYFFLFIFIFGHNYYYYYYFAIIILYYGAFNIGFSGQLPSTEATVACQVTFLQLKHMFCPPGYLIFSTPLSYTVNNSAIEYEFSGFTGIPNILIVSTFSPSRFPYNSSCINCPVNQITVNFCCCHILADKWRMNFLTQPHQ